MCGINAIVGGGHLERAFVDQHMYIMANATRHRGMPENFDERTTLDDCVLSVNRLPITSDLGERQPVANEDGTVLAILNGEIYNFKRLKKQLLMSGHQFKTNSDTEVLVHMYEERGVGMVDSLDGMFAFVIYDSKDGRYVAARDPTGIKPLYYAKKNNILYVSSEIKGLSKLDINEIKFVPPGYILTREGEKRYFSIQPAETPQQVGPIVEELRVLVDNAIRKMIDTPLPIGVLFSGGIDSSTVLSTAIKYHPKVSAITFGIPGSPDREIAERYCSENSIPLIVAEPVGWEHSASEFVRVAETIETSIIRHIAGNYIASRIAHDNGFRIVLVGESSDELFGGYNIFKEVDNNLVTDISVMLVGDLHRTQLQRVDRGSMRWTVEARVPFQDPALMRYALGIPNRYKVFHAGNQVIEKWILRQAMADRLPPYITTRLKEDFCTGGGLDVDDQNGTFTRLAEKNVDNKTFNLYRRTFPEYDLRNKEEVMNFMIFISEGYTKARFTQQRIRTAREETRKRILRLTSQ